MKGGVTSGVVYPYAILELAKRYRLRSIGGTSAGAIAAAFAAAAEYGRQNGDPDAFVRLQKRCDTIPDILGGLFQPSAEFRPLMTALQALSSRGSAWRRAAGALWPLKRPLLVGGGAGLAVYLAAAGVLGLAVWPLGADLRPTSWWALLPGAVLATLAGSGLNLLRHARDLFGDHLPRNNFGFCSGLAVAGDSAPVLTEWIHASLQEIAFGPGGRDKPLTFGDLAHAGRTARSKGKSIDLRMMTTNLSLGRPHAAPDFNLDLLYSPVAWSKLFPKPVMDYLLGARDDGRGEVSPREDGGFRALPRADDLPVIVAVRMSLSFPILVQAIPMAMRDVGAAARGELASGAKPPIVPLLFSDGGLSSNFPIHFFDAMLPQRPTFALSLDPLPKDRAGEDRVSMPQGAAGGSFSPVKSITTLPSFGVSVFDAAKDWQDQMLSTMPGQRERVVRIRLTADEGGLNLTMPPDVSRKLMEYGRQAGETIVTRFDFDEHRWRRTLVAYRALEETVHGVGRIWPAHGQWFDEYWPQARSYQRIAKNGRGPMISTRFGAFAALAAGFDPPLVAKVQFPKPPGRLRVMPDT